MHRPQSASGASRELFERNIVTVLKCLLFRTTSKGGRSGLPSRAVHSACRGRIAAVRAAEGVTKRIRSPILEVGIKNGQDGNGARNFGRSCLGPVRQKRSKLVGGGLFLTPFPLPVFYYSKQSSSPGVEYAPRVVYTPLLNTRRHSGCCRSHRRHRRYYRWCRTGGAWTSPSLAVGADGCLPDARRPPASCRRLHRASRWRERNERVHTAREPACRSRY